MSQQLTIVLHYFNNRAVVEKHLERFMNFSPRLLRAINLLLVDDCSVDEERVAFDELLSQWQPVSLNLSVYRITDDIPWNQTGARNLGCFQSKTDWLFCTDIDHVLQEEDVERLLRYVQSGLNAESLYRTQRRNILTLESQNPHANTFLVHRGSFVEVGGYDEDFAGGAGHSDKYFFHLWRAAGKNIEQLDDVYVYVDGRAGTKALDRSPDRNRQLYQRKMSGEVPENAHRINFNWRLEFTCQSSLAAHSDPTKMDSGAGTSTQLSMATEEGADTWELDASCYPDTIPEISRSSRVPAAGSEVVVEVVSSDDIPSGSPSLGMLKQEIAVVHDAAQAASVSSSGSSETRGGKTARDLTEIGQAFQDRQSSDTAMVVPASSSTVPTPQPLMSAAEIELLQAGIAAKRCAVEFGTGGSTFLLAAADIDRIVSVDSDERWVRSVAEHPAIAPCVASGRLVMLHVDIGRIRKWGYPQDDERQADWHRYWEEPWLHVDPSSVDLVIIDGRFRVACGLNALIAGNGDMTVIIHDFWTRTAYHDLLKYFNCAARIDNLAVLFPKKTISLGALRVDLERFSMMPR